MNFLSPKKSPLKKSKIMSKREPLRWNNEPKDPAEEEDPGPVRDYTGCERSHHTKFQIYGVGAEPYWNKQFLPLLYESLDYKGVCCDTDMLGAFKKIKKTQIVKSQVYKTHCDFNEKKLVTTKTLTHEFEWKVEQYRGLLDNKDVEEMCRDMNWDNPYIWGARHNNRLRRGTKVFFRAGKYKDMHGVIVGCGGGFRITDHYNKVIYCYVLLATEEVVWARQDYLKLADIHQKLPFGIPKPIKKKRSGWGAESTWTTGFGEGDGDKTGGWWDGSYKTGGSEANKSCKDGSDGWDEKPRAKRNRNN